MRHELKAQEAKIVNELIECQGPAVDIGGYWMPDAAKCEAAMRPSATFNKRIDLPTPMSKLATSRNQRKGLSRLIIQ